MNTIVVFTQKDMNDLCAILSRNGYVATAYNIVSSTGTTCCGKQWRIDYYDSKDVIANVSESDFNEPYKVFYPLGASYYQYAGGTPNELFPDTIWEYRGNIQGIPCWVRIK